jgi:hypothetical protein
VCCCCRILCFTLLCLLSKTILIMFPGMNLRAAVGEIQESPTSDFVDDSASELADSTCSSGHSPSPAPPSVASTLPSKHKHPQHMPYDPLVRSSFHCPNRIIVAVVSCLERGNVQGSVTSFRFISISTLGFTNCLPFSRCMSTQSRHTLSRASFSWP